MCEVSLEDMLAARDHRAVVQQRLLRQFGRPLLCFTMNIAGPVKRSGLIDYAFRAGARAVQKRLGTSLLHEELTDAPTGLELAWACDAPAESVKAAAMDIENTPDVGRLYDLDVLGPDGHKLSRPSARKCLVCGGPAGPCARSRAHGLDAVQSATETLLKDFACQSLSGLAVAALIDEVNLTPKPGLVDQRNNGAHHDMNLPLFYRSAQCLRPYFAYAVSLGLDHAHCMPALQKAGLAAEQTMLATTKGVNTHKGAIYAFGLILAALGNCLARSGDLFATAAALAEAGTPPDTATHGAQALARYGAHGARGEALNGFPHARMALHALERGPFAALLTLLSRVEDTNLLYRGGADALLFLHNQSADILAGSEEDFIPRLEALDDACITRNISPGGCADLLALAFLLRDTQDIWA